MKADGGLRQLFRAHLPTIHWLTVENVAEVGTPDLNGCYAGTEIWIECKRTAGWRIAITPQQIGWLLRRSRAGGRTFVAIRRRAIRGAQRAAADELWIYRGADIAELRNGLKALTPRGRWSGGPRTWDWAAIEALLLGPEPASKSSP